MGRVRTIARRSFIIGSAAVAGGVVFGFWKYKQPHGNPLLSDLRDGDAALTPYVRIDGGGITIITPRAEMGQGVHTTLAALVAEELDVSMDAIHVEHGPASKAYYNEAVLEEAVPFAQTDMSDMAERVRGLTKIPAKFLSMQITGGSSSTPDAFVKMRAAGAAARAVLLEAAAARLSVEATTLQTESGNVIAANGQRLDYVDLAVAAAAIEPPAEPKLKPTSQWRLLGKSLPRVDTVAKSTGTAEYGIDIRLPNMAYATVKRNPHLGAAMNSFDASKSLSMAGNIRIIELDDGVVVVADNTWRAFRAANAIEFDWAPADYPASSDEMLSRVAAAIDDDLQDSQFRDDGDVASALLEADVVEAEYQVPLLAHATMEPMNATAWLRDGRLDVWAGTQVPTQARKEGALIAGLDEENVHVHTPFLGGGFGRRAEMDFVQIAVAAATQLEGTPVKVTWSREEDMTHDQYRPPAMARFRGAVEQGKPTALDMQVSAPSVVESQMGRLGLPVPGPDISIVQAAWDQPYSVPNYRVTGYRAEAMIPISSWRSVGASQNGFFHESFIDELAVAAGRDPLQMRLEMVNHHPSRQVLKAVADMSGWGAERAAGRALGVAFVLSFGVPTAQVVEVENTDKGFDILNVWAAVDVGTALDPRNIEAQVQSGINFGLAAAVMGEITVANGKVEQSNFHHYDAIRIAQAPAIAVRVLENGEKIRGIGEPGLPPVAPALANAIYAASGQRLRQLPLSKYVNFV